MFWVYQNLHYTYQNQIKIIFVKNINVFCYSTQSRAKEKRKIDRELSKNVSVFCKIKKIQLVQGWGVSKKQKLSFCFIWKSFTMTSWMSKLHYLGFQSAGEREKWSEAYWKLVSGKGVLGQIETLENQQKKIKQQAKWTA